MKQIIAAAGAFMLLAAPMAMAQSTTPPGVECTKTPPNEPGNENAQSVPGAREHFVKGSCETLVMPNGRTEVQNGPAATDIGGTASPRDSGGGGGAAGAAAK